MMTAHAFRRTLAHRLLALLATSLPAASLLPGCGPTCGGSTPSTGEQCIDAPDGGTGDAGEPAACPSRAEAQSIIEGEDFVYVLSIDSDGTMKYGRCCYTATTQPVCIGGRPFLIEGTPRTAEARMGARGWTDEGALVPDLRDLSKEERAHLAAAWAKDGLFEHASVASFGRFALELLAAGAPSDLIDDAHQAARDEVRHARLCLSLASAYAGEPTAPGAFPFDGHVDVTADLGAIAARAAREGAVGETIAAVTAAAQLERASDPAVRAALSIIAADEARHAELAWRTVAWAVRVGGAPVRAAVAAVLADLGGGGAVGEGAGASDRLIAHGRLGEAELREAAARAIDDVVRPAARLLLAASAAQDGVPVSAPTA